MNPSNLIQEKKLVICLKCGHEFRTKVSSPRCSKCGSRKISDIKKAGKKEVQLLHIKIRDLEEDLQRHKEKVAEDFKSVGYDMQSLYKYLEQIAAVLKKNKLIPEPQLKKNKLIPEPQEEMVSPREKKNDSAAKIIFPKW